MEPERFLMSWRNCCDHWHDNYVGAPANEAPWLEQDDAAPRVLRGGSWDDYGFRCRSAARTRFERGATREVGLRLAMQLM